MIIETRFKHYLLPSTLFAEAEPHMIDTVLGSCVSVCLFDHKLRIGGMNHYMLPLWNGEGLASPKYGNIANEKLFEKLMKLGCKPQNMIAKVFGGANQMSPHLNIGERNIDVATEQLKTFGISLVKHSLGGAVGRKVRFDSGTGEVLMRFLSRENEKD